MKKKDLTGQRFGRLVVIAEAPPKTSPNGSKKTIGICRCDCGKETSVHYGNLAYGETSSCGCLGREKLAKASTKHGHARKGKVSGTFITWEALFSRCYNPKNAAYAQYGGRGIIVCERWHKFENFLADMGERPVGKSIDRIDGSKGYCKENCRWATPKEQSNNRPGFIRLITHRGITQHLTAWATQHGMRANTLLDRIRRGWEFDRALSEPVATTPNGKRK